MALLSRRRPHTVIGRACNRSLPNDWPGWWLAFSKMTAGITVVALAATLRCIWIQILLKWPVCFHVLIWARGKMLQWEGIWPLNRLSVSRWSQIGWKRLPRNPKNAKIYLLYWHIAWVFVILLIIRLLALVISWAREQPTTRPRLVSTCYRPIAIDTV